MKMKKTGNMATRGSIGIDIGGTKSLFALFDEKFNLVMEVKETTHPEKGGGRSFRKMAKGAVAKLLKEAKKRGIKVACLGVGCAGSIDSDKAAVRRSPNAAFLKDLSFRTFFKPILEKAEVHALNDVQAGLYGESQLGAAQGRKNVLCIFIGTGIGGAVMFDGRLYQGATGAAGDIGNYLLHPIGSLSGSARQGVLDDVASRTAIAGDAAALAVKRWAPELKKLVGTDVLEIKSGDLAAAISKGDKSIEDLVRSRARVIGIVLSNLVDFLNPDMVVLGGGLVDAMPKIFRNEVMKGIKAHTTKEALRGLEVVATKLAGHAVTVGAAKFAWDSMEGQRPLHRKGGKK